MCLDLAALPTELLLFKWDEGMSLLNHGTQKTIHKLFFFNFPKVGNLLGSFFIYKKKSTHYV